MIIAYQKLRFPILIMFLTDGKFEKSDNIFISRIFILKKEKHIRIC